MKLVIVESPTKCNTIQKYLGDEYIVKASLGHIRDLATSGKGGLGVDVDNNFAATYALDKKKSKVIKELQKLAKEADEVILATDPDREGEAIAWHLAQVLKLDIKENKRLEFHEITRDSITEAMANPRTIDESLVSAQETRRILDRIIGFKLSSLMYKKIHSRSAGRVQSATLKLIYDHQLEIDQFISKEYWSILVSVLFNKKDLKVTYVSFKDDKKDIETKAEADSIISAIPSELTVKSVQKAIKLIESRPPFTTSTLQQEAFSRLKFKASKTQFIAQKLYEGIDVAGEHVGLITYMRTDASRLSPSYVARANNFIVETFGKDYLGAVKKGKAAALAQDAHEAIRPTGNHRTPESVRKYLTPDEYSLYKLIYERTLASLMKPKKEEVLNVVLEGNGVEFKFDISRTLFKGFELIYKEDDQKDSFAELPDIKVGDKFPVSNKSNEQKFTQPPALYTEAKIIKLMEELGIGRPSTYATTIETLRKRKYITEEKGSIVITEQGKKTAHVLEKYFPDVVNLKYTADMEQKLDFIEEGKDTELNMLINFYEPFLKTIEDANNKMYKDENKYLEGELCPKCGAPLVVKDGKNGKFVGCSNYPTCDYIKKEPKKPEEFTGENCPLCGKPLVKRKDKKGKPFIGCSGYPTCKYVVSILPKQAPELVDKKCPKCGASLVKKKGKFGYFYGCSNYPNCDYMEKIFRKGHK